MSNLDKRREMYEAKFKADEDFRFKVRVKSVKQFGLWAADKIGLDGTEAETYAKQLLDVDFESPSHDEILNKVEKDLNDKDLEISRHVLDSELEDAEERVVKEILEDGSEELEI